MDLAVLIDKAVQVVRVVVDVMGPGSFRDWFAATVRSSQRIILWIVDPACGKEFPGLLQRVPSFARDVLGRLRAGKAKGSQENQNGERCSTEYFHFATRAKSCFQHGHQTFPIESAPIKDLRSTYQCQTKTRCLPTKSDGISSKLGTDGWNIGSCTKSKLLSRHSLPQN
jgi:hypothetical protein